MMLNGCKNSLLEIYLENVPVSTALPDFILQLPRLQILSLAGSSVGRLPSGPYLDNLEVLDLSFTHLRFIPPSFQRARKLKVLLLECCAVEPSKESTGAHPSKTRAANVNAVSEVWMV